jgi:hypothetical protein
VGNLKGKDYSEDRRKREDNIKSYLSELGLEGVDWINLLGISTGLGLL